VQLDDELAAMRNSRRRSPWQSTDHPRFLPESIHSAISSAIWTYRFKPSQMNVTGRPRNPLIHEFIERHRGRYLAVPGFDELMLLLGDVFGIPKLDKEMELEAASRLSTYRDELEKTVRALKTSQALPGSPQLKEWTDAVLERMLGEKERRDWYDWYLAAAHAPPEQAEATYLEGLAILPDSPALRACYAAFRAGKNPQDSVALETARRAFDEGKTSLGFDHPETLMAAHQLGRVLYFRGDFSEAEDLYRSVSETRERVLGSDHPDTLGSVNSLAILLAAKGDRAAAERLYQRAFETMERVLGPDHPHTLMARSNLALLLRSGKPSPDD
jgi:tetratricopeptide (TPR) repeat protein